MRALVALILAFCLVILPVGSARPQTSRPAPPGVEPIPGYTGLYVADAARFMAGAFLMNMLTRPRDVRAFLARVKTCASSRPLAFRLRDEGVRTAMIPFSEVVPALRSGSCDIFIGTNFSLAQLNIRLNPDNGPSDDVTPRPPDDVTPDDDVIVDRTPPQIAPLRQVFEGPDRTIKVSARITDSQSGIRAAYVATTNGRRVRMSASQGSSTYSATVDLPPNFDNRIVTIVVMVSASLAMLPSQNAMS